MRKMLLSGLVVFFLILVLPVTGSSRTHFKTSDFNGSWHMYNTDIYPTLSAVFWDYGLITVENGSVTNGTYYIPNPFPPHDPPLIEVNIIEGSMTLDSYGNVLGSSTVTNPFPPPATTTATIPFGTMDKSKTKGAFIATGSDGSMGIGTFIKSGGGPFATADLEGTWYMYNTDINTELPAVFWDYGTFTVANNGSITAGSYTFPNPIPPHNPPFLTAAVLFGEMSLDQEGKLSGFIMVDDPFSADPNDEILITIIDGKMDQGKTSGSLVSIDSNDGLGVGHFFKHTGTFTTSDFQGTWHLYAVNVDFDINGVYWVRAIFTVDETGKVSNASFIFPNPDPEGPLTIEVGVTQGNVTVDSDGILNGTFALETGDMVTIIHGKMDQAKTSGGFVSVGWRDDPSNVNALTNALFYKVDKVFSWPSFLPAITAPKKK